MKTNGYSTTDSSTSNTSEAQFRLKQLVEYLRDSVHRVDDPRAQALFETSAEVLLGLNNAFTDYARNNEAAWQSRETSTAMSAAKNAHSASGPGAQEVSEPHTIEDDYNQHDASFRRHYQLKYSDSEHPYEFYKQAYRFGYELAKENADTDWETAQASAQRHWEQMHNSAWNDIAEAMRYGWEEQRNPEALRVHHDDTYLGLRSTFRKHFAESMRGSALPFERYEPAYRYGYNLGVTPENQELPWEDVEPQLHKYYESEYADGELAWKHYRDAAKHAWYHVQGAAATI